MKITELEVKESLDGELYFRLPDDLLNRLGWKEGDELKFIPQDDAFIIKKVKYENVELQFDDEELLKYMTFAHERNITFNELCEEAVKAKIDEVNCK
ncbi:MAG: AbrB/MazE/SpoVT family DNA-binding domain-containing protein [Bacteroidetes bacterium]|nr:AbrB/MazE/SpoVT family DNA-binding domain-containing protein [Bacteroidota bacterium]